MVNVPTQTRAPNCRRPDRFSESSGATGRTIEHPGAESSRRPSRAPTRSLRRIRHDDSAPADRAEPRQNARFACQARRFRLPVVALICRREEVHMSPTHQAVLEALYNCTEASEEHLAYITGLPIDTIIRVLHDL